MTVVIDIETYSDVDLKAVGSFVYAQSCELLLVGYAVDDGEAAVWDLITSGHSPTNNTMPPELHEALQRRGDIRIAHNASGFERWVLATTLPDYDWSIETWFDTMILCAVNGLPRGLSMACDAVDMRDDYAKLGKSGMQLITTFCKPAPSNHKAGRYTPHNKPEEWGEFIEYCRRDVTSCRELYDTLPHQNYEKEKENWRANLRMNDRGLPMDTYTSQLLILEIRKAEKELVKELPSLTNNVVSTASQVALILGWIRGQGFAMPDMRAASVETALTMRDKFTPEIHRVLRIRQLVSKSSVKKLDKVIHATAMDGALHGGFEFYGAGRTGREAGRLFQPQNLPRPTKEFKDPEVIDSVIKMLHDGKSLRSDNAHIVGSNLIRSMLSAPKGYELVVADLANIEGRVLAWLAGETWKLKAFFDFDKGIGEDIYKLAYSKSFGVDVVDVDDDMRAVGKVQELACGFQGGVGAFTVMAQNYGVHLPEERILEIVRAWRGAHPLTVCLWWDAQNACFSAMNSPDEPFWIGPKVVVAYRKALDQLAIRLPSGRQLVYPSPSVTEVMGRRRLWFKGLENYKWAPTETYGGKLVENITQAVARDILFNGVIVSEKNGMSPVGTVHDEIISLEKKGAFTHEQLCGYMTDRPEWISGLPLAAEGYTAGRYRK